MRRCATRFAVLVVVALSTRAWGWTAPLEISAPSSSERSTPRIACGGSGAVHLVYLQKGDWSIHYRLKSAVGNWGAVEQVSNAGSVRPDVVEDSTGRVHVMFGARPTGSQIDLYHTWKSGGVWNSAYLMTTSDFEDEPRLAADTQGRVHMVYTRGAVESGPGDVIYRVWDGSWSGETILGQVTQAYYHRPDITIDSAGNLHVVWIQLSGSVYKVRYRKNSGGSWGGTGDVGSGSTSSSTTHFFNYPRIAVASSSNVCVVWHDDTNGSGSNIAWNYSSNGGSNWAYGLSGTDQGQNLYAGHYPQLDSGTSGSVHLISSQEPTEKILVYSKWTGGASWPVLKQQVNTNPYWQGWCDITEDPTGDLHVVVDNPYGGGATNEHFIAYLTTASDVVPPAPVSAFTATAFHNKVRLSWSNPHDPDFNGTMIRYSTSGFPSGPASGTLLADRSAVPGSTDAYDHNSVSNGTIYYYAAFAHDSSSLYSSGQTASGRPFVPMDFDRDGDVDQVDFGVFQNCMTPLTIPPSFECAWADFNTDQSVNGDDFAAFLNCWSGPDLPYAPSCAG